MQAVAAIRSGAPADFAFVAFNALPEMINSSFLPEIEKAHAEVMCRMCFELARESAVEWFKYVLPLAQEQIKQFSERFGGGPNVLLDKGFVNLVNKIRVWAQRSLPRDQYESFLAIILEENAKHPSPSPPEQEEGIQCSGL